MTEVHLVFPAGYDDRRRPSGGNVYDRELAAGLPRLGWTVAVHEIPGSWPAPVPAAGPRVSDAVDGQLALIPGGRAVLVDGLLARAAAPALARHADRLRLAVLVHMPGPPGGPTADGLRPVRLVITTSSWTAQQLPRGSGPTGPEVVVAPPGAPTAEVAPGSPTGGALLCVAAVTPAKGQDLLVQALAGLRSRPWSCACVGPLDRDAEFVRRQQQALSDHGLADRVVFTGPLAGAELGRAYAAADLLVLPTRLESYGLVVTEALARGVPVVATRVGGVPEALGVGSSGRPPGLLVPPDDAPALRAALALWLDEPEVRDVLRAAARSRRATLAGWPETVAAVASALGRLAAA